MENKIGQLCIHVCECFGHSGSGFLKKGQLRIQEMSFMLLAVMLFFILVGLFMVSLMSSNLKNEAGKIQEIRALSSVVNLVNSPEFNCVGGRSDCVDADKLVGLMKGSAYGSFWDFSSLEVIRLSGFDKGGEEMVNCDREGYVSRYDCDRFVIFDKGVKNEKKIGSFVGLCRVEYENNYAFEKCEVGKVIVGMEVVR